MAATNKSMLEKEERSGLIGASRMTAESDEMEVDMVALLYRLIEKLKWIIAAALLGALLAGIYTANFVTPLYKASSTLYVVNPSDSAIDLTALSLGDKLAADYVQVFKIWHVHEKVISSLGLPYSYRQLQNMLNVTSIANTRMIKITVTSPDPQEAYNIAMAYAEFASAFIEAKMETDKPNIIEEARVPKAPAYPNKTRNIVLGFLLFGILAAVIVVVQFIVDDRIRNTDVVERRLGLPVLGMMPVQENEHSRKSGKGRAKA